MVKHAGPSRVMPDEAGAEQPNHTRGESPQPLAPAAAQLVVHAAQDITHGAGFDGPIRRVQFGAMSRQPPRPKTMIMIHRGKTHRCHASGQTPQSASSRV